MCIIIDTNVLKNVLDPDNKNHNEFKDVYDWIFNGKGKILYGGSKYLKEISKYAVLFGELKKIGKALSVQSDLVDAEELIISQLINHPDFDDQHLVALLRVSKCKLICSLDARAYPYFRHSTFFQPANIKPKIYSGSRNKSLLCDRNICECCKPATTTSNRQKLVLKTLFG